MFWWWMEANEYGLDWNTKRVTDNWYNAGLFDNQTGRAEPALSVLKDFVGEDSGISVQEADGHDSNSIYTIDGRKVTTTGKLPHGLYIINRKKTLVN